MHNFIWEAHIKDRFNKHKRLNYIVRTALDKTESWGFPENVRLQHVIDELVSYYTKDIKVEDCYTIVMHTEYVKLYLYGIGTDGNPLWCENPESCMEFEGQDKAEGMKLYLDQPHLCVEPIE